MTGNAVIVVRMYVTESSNLLAQIVEYLQKETTLRGVSVFRAISGFGDSGAHGMALVDLSLDLPLAIEFFGAAEQVNPALEYLKELVKPGHIIYWEARSL